MQIVTNGTSSRLRKKALQDPKYSLANMLIDGRKYETSSAQAVGIEEQFKTRENINATAMATPTEKKCYYCRCKYPHDNQPCPAKSAICNHCGIKGHFAKVCRTRGKSFASKGNLEKLQTQGFTSPDKRRQSRWDENKQRKQQAKVVGISQSESNTESSEDEDYVYTVSQETREKTHTTVKINGQDVLFLVDTGATVDIIDSTTYANLKRKNGAGGNLLSAKTAQDLGLVQLIHTISGFLNKINKQRKTKQNNTHSTACETNPEINTSVPQSKDPKIQEIINKYSTFFKGQGKLNNQQIKLHIRDDVKPVMQRQRRIPYHVRNDVSKELKKLEEQDIVEKVANQPTPWISPIVDRHAKERRSAAEIFQNVLQQNLSDIRGVKNLVDDIIIHGKTRKSHDEALENCLKRLAALNLKVKGGKYEFLQDEITFFGLKFTAAGTKPDPERIENMVRVPAPKTAGEVRSFLGMVNTLATNTFQIMQLLQHL
ncbi:Hypothetical predicted protein [Paramuricea clavata]|uniref:Uncharacterized protein n=1 Tax=Paramuricea clavata TaxID=317549 RepID=A0A7D9HZJ3_PARCT|nr:Hypothetical predicted protein [Paramuricea clavata]